MILLRSHEYFKAPKPSYFWLLVIFFFWSGDLNLILLLHSKVKSGWRHLLKNAKCHNWYVEDVMIWAPRYTAGQILGLQFIDERWKEMFWPWTQLHRGGKTNNSILCLLNRLHFFSCCPVTGCSYWDCNKQRRRERRILSLLMHMYLSIIFFLRVIYLYLA